MKTVLSSLLATALINTLIAALLTAIGFGGNFTINLVYSQCIGLSNCALGLVVLRCLPAGRLRQTAILPALCAASFFGFMLAHFLIAGGDSTTSDQAGPAVLLGLVFGGIVSAFFYLRERNASLQAEIHRRDLLRLEAEKRQIQAQLNLLQAQIEPHFLFNSLANVSVLIDSDPALANRLLAALIRYLRASLAHTRAASGTLGDEIAMLRAYLETLQIRMGKRLDFHFAIDDALLAMAFPPMLLQPLVENAVIHGLEPLAEGGVITICAQKKPGCLKLAVHDNGCGFSPSDSNGLGLSNVRSRLQALFGDAGRLVLSENNPKGVIATLEIPA